MTPLIKRAGLTPSGKQASFRRAFEVIGAHRENDDFMAAYMVAFSVFEDRVTACMSLSRDLERSPRPTKFVPLGARIRELFARKHISDETQADWLDCAAERNELIHAAMWNIDVFEDAHAVAAIRRARKADSLARKLGRSVPKSG